jgi:hypothetical protein
MCRTKHQTVADFQQEDVYLYFLKRSLEFIVKSASFTAEMHSATDSQKAPW